MNPHKQRLFLFRSLDGQSRTYTEEILRDAQLFLASPADFNDPYDCYLPVDGTTLSQVKRRNIAKFAARLANPVRVKLNPVKARLRIKDLEFLEAYARGDLRDKLFKDIHSTYGICCFASNRFSYRSILMWSHYASKHRGICFQFDIDRLDQNWISLKPVQYRKYPPTIKLGTPNEEQIYTVKSRRWDYEKEMRLVLKGKANSKFNFSRRDLTAVYFGYKTPEKVKDTVIDWLDKYQFPHTAHYQIELKPRHFGLKRTLLPSSTSKP